MSAAVQDCRKARDTATTLLWVSTRDSEWCCALQWETSDLLSCHCPLLGTASPVTGRRAHSCFHVTKPFLLPCKKHSQRN